MESPTLDPADVEVLPYQPTTPVDRAFGRVRAGVRLRHRPTGIEVTFADYGNMRQNHRAALEILARMLTGAPPDGILPVD